MSTRLTLLFLCDQSSLYSGFISAFASAGFQVLLASSVSHAGKILNNRPVDAVIIRHDSQCDDRAAAIQFKRRSPRLPVFLITEEPQPRQDGIDSVWRAKVGDDVVTHAMAAFFKQYFLPSRSSRSGKLVSDSKFRPMQVTPQQAS